MRISTPTLSLLSLLCLCALCVPILASRGDQLVEFKECVKYCINENCNASHPTALPFHLRLLLWTCPQECDYSCQRTITAERLSSIPPLSVEQFHGKWPFRRILGVQEPFSVIFSLANLYAHIWGVRKVRKEMPIGHGMRKYYLWFGYLGHLCWACSAVFHTRDFWWTERADYFAAGANVVYGLFLALVRVAGLYPRMKRRGKDVASAVAEKIAAAGSSSGVAGTSSHTTTSSSKNPKGKATTAGNVTPRVRFIRPVALLLTTLYLAHVSYLSFIRWSYTYNMAANVFIGALTNLLWTYFSISHYRKLRKPWAAWPGLIVTWLVMAMSLELLDFPPILDALDAHALWHASTVIPTLWWYRFLIRDAKEEEEMAGLVGGGRPIPAGKEVKD